MTKRPLIVVALVPNLVRTTPGQRAAIESWEPHLREQDIVIKYLEFETQELREVLYARGNTRAKTYRMLSAYVRRLSQLPHVRHADLVYVYREAALIGPGIIERFLSATNMPYIYSLDDPIFVPYESPYQGKFSKLKFPGKVKNIVRHAKATLANSHPILAWARQYSNSVYLVPSAVDTNLIKPRMSQATGTPVIGWSGSDTTAGNLEMIGEVLLEVQQATDARIHLMGAQSYQLPSDLKRVEFTWSPENEAEVVGTFDIGIAPMPDNPWNHWKFSGKVTYFMALGIPTVATPIGDIPAQLRHGIDGYLADNAAAWRESLMDLCTSPQSRNQFGVEARARACSYYSVDRVSSTVASVISVVARR